MAAQKGTQPLFANYWEDDTVMNPVIVRIDHYLPDEVQQDVYIPSLGVHRQVHIHNLGAPHGAW